MNNDDRDFAIMVRGLLALGCTMEDQHRAIKAFDDARTSPSVQCPYCKWGFYPSGTTSTFREKHS